MNIFDIWNNEKKILNESENTNFYVNTREIWFTKMGKNVGFEEDGKDDFLRPVLVIKKVGSLFFTVALTSRGKKENKFYHKFKEIELSEKNRKYLNTSYSILSQVKTMDKRRFTQYLGKISEKEFKTIKQKLKALLL